MKLVFPKKIIPLSEGMRGMAFRNKIRQILRVLRMVYFMNLKCQEQMLYHIICEAKNKSNELTEVYLKFFYVTVRLSCFDDMDNYNNTIKSALNMLSKFVCSDMITNDIKLQESIISVLKNYYRSDMI